MVFGGIYSVYIMFSKLFVCDIKIIDQLGITLDKTNQICTYADNTARIIWSGWLRSQGPMSKCAGMRLNINISRILIISVSDNIMILYKLCTEDILLDVFNNFNIWVT